MLHRSLLVWVWFAAYLCAPNLASAWAQNEKPKDEARQPPKVESPAETTPERAPRVKPSTGPAAPPPSELDTYMLRDKKGNLVPVIGLSFEDFEKLVQIQKGLLPPPPPAYAFDSLTLTGKADGATAEFQATASVRVKQPGWVRIPLRFGGGALLEPAKHNGPGDFLLSVAGDGEGYLLWLKGEGKAHQIQLKLAMPVGTIGLERRLQLNLPRATESAVRLQVPLTQANASLRNGSEGILTTRSLAAGQSEIQVVGPTGDLHLFWQAGRAPSPEAKPTLEAVGEIIVRVESRSRISSEARLKLRTLGKPMETVAVRLPPGMQLVPVPATGYTATIAESTDVNKNNAGRLVDVRFDRPTTGPIEIRLLAEQEVAANATDTALRPARFDVIGAQRQRGNIDFLVEGDWNLGWSDEASTQRLELLDAPVANGRPVARFGYFKQPLDLKLSVSPRPTRIAVEPQYQVYADASLLRLEATFRFRIRGPKATSTNLDLAGWRVDRIVGENAAEQPLPPAEEVPMLTLPLAQLDAAKGELTYRIEAHQPLASEADTVRFSLPRPQVDVAAPASIVVQPADNVELVPTATELKGLVADATLGTALPNTRQQPPLLYRDLGSSEAIAFVAARRVRSRHVSVKAETLLRLRRSTIEVQQQLDYQIAYESKRSYLLALPSDLSELKGFQVSLNEQLLEHRPAPNDDGRNLLEVIDTQDRLGAVKLQLRYSLPMPALKANPATHLQVPLVVPADTDFDRLLGQTIRIEHSEELHLKIPESASSEESLAPSQRGVLEGKSDKLLTSLSLNVSLQQTPEISGLVIDRMWVQTWLSPQQRQERCVLQLRTAAPTIVARLPVAVAASNIQLIVDGKHIPAQTAGERTVNIDLGTATTPQVHVVELWYSLPRTRAGWWIADHQFTPPQLEGANSPQRIQWQVVLPSHEHLLFEPRDYAPEMKWGWKNYYWSRMANFNQQSLEDWCGASRQEPLPSSLNNYLFSSVGSEPTLQLQTIGQRALAAWLAGLGLALGLLFLHVPLVRSSTGLLVLVVLLLALGVAAPQTMLFVAQAIALGLVIVAILAAIRWLWTGQVPRPPQPLPRSLSNLSSPRSTGSRSAGPPATTAAAPVLPPATHEVEL
ncbi:hypothetical protein ETAA8_19640 [Anatilimnocola aggregata]|uniref:Uncharacterized protein n=2 Tax=Anatilimnocola aggregata TaxID=2528021 RepID=A0A517Y9H4_9BACT|nr:hypothetical protein ETAA8_19640 [Anatilimnocola aggregata]